MPRFKKYLVRIVATILVLVMSLSISKSTLSIAEERKTFLGAIGRAIGRAAHLSNTPVEYELFKQVEKWSRACTSCDQVNDHYALSKWLIGDAGLTEAVELRLVTCVYIFSGTDRSLVREEMAVHSQLVTGSKEASLVVVLKTPCQHENSLAHLAAVVEATEGQRRILYSVGKSFEHIDNRWELLSSAVEKEHTTTRGRQPEHGHEKDTKR